RVWECRKGKENRGLMANSFGTDILIQAPDPKIAASFYVDQLGFVVTRETPLLSLHGEHINLFIEQGPALGPVLEVMVPNVEEAKLRLVQNGCKIVKEEPGFPLLHPGSIRIGLQFEDLAHRSGRPGHRPMRVPKLPAPA